MKPTKNIFFAIFFLATSSLFAQSPTNPTNNTSTPVGGQNPGQNFNQQMVPSSGGAVGASGYTGSGTIGSPTSTGYTGIGGTSGSAQPTMSGPTGSPGTPANPSNYYPMPQQAPRRDQ